MFLCSVDFMRLQGSDFMVFSSRSDSEMRCIDFIEFVCIYSDFKVQCLVPVTPNLGMLRLSRRFFEFRFRFTPSPSIHTYSDMPNSARSLDIDALIWGDRVEPVWAPRTRLKKRVQNTRGGGWPRKMKEERSSEFIICLNIK